MQSFSLLLKHLYPVLVALLLTGCAAQITTLYQTPEVTMPAAWEKQTATASPPPDHWWQGFGDPVLDSLIKEVLRRNNDLAAAAILVRRAQLQAEQANSDRLPGLTVQGSGNLNRNLGEGSGETRSLAISGTIGYELDLWGKLGSSYDAARWEAEATEEDRASTEIALIATTASLYWQIGYLNQRIGLSEASVDYARHTLELAEVRRSAGAATALEVLEAERSLASQEASQTTLIQQRVEARNGLAILFDGPPQSLKTTEPPDVAMAALPEVAACLPAQLLARRPDLRAAEARLRSTLATTDTSRASLYPTINLSGSLGGSSDSLSRLLSNPVGTLASELVLPFVQWREMQRNIKISETEYKQAILSFRQTLYGALAEVENSLSAQQQYRLQAEKLGKAMQTASRIEELYRIRFQSGVSLLTSWLDAQENQRQAEIALAENRLNQIQNHITLCKALGGDSQGDLLVLR